MTPELPTPSVPQPRLGTETTGRPNLPGSFSTLLFIAKTAGVVLVLGASLATSWRYITHNESTVVPGELFRAAQLNVADLRKEIETHHIRSIVNLRGRNPKSPWWVQEVALCREMGLAHADISLNARHLPRPDEVADLIRAYDTLPLPILIHCNAGSDRTGWAGAVYLMERKGLSPGRAAQALSWHFGHVALCPYFEMDEFFDLYKEENPFRRPLSDWVQDDYPAIYKYEETETTWHEMLEPFESLAGVSFWQPTKSRLVTSRS